MLLQHKNRNTQKVIKSLQHHISHEIRSYSSINATRVSSYTCFRLFWSSGKFRLTRPKYPNPKSLAPHFTSDEALHFCQDFLRFKLYLFFGYLSIKAIWRRRGPNTSCTFSQKKWYKYFSSILHIRWDLTLVSKSSLGWVTPVPQILKYWGPNTLNHVLGHMKSNPKSSSPYLKSNETLH